MTLELSLLWGVHAVLAIIFLGVMASVLRSSSRHKLAYRFSQRIELPFVTDAIAAAAERRMLHSTLAMQAGGVIGLAASAMVVYLNPTASSAPASIVWLVTLPLTLTGMCAGSATVALRESLFRRHPDAVRLARATTIRIRDYVSPRRLWTPLTLLIVAALMSLSGLVFSWTHLIDDEAFLRSAALPTLVIATIVIALGGLLAHRVLRQPQPVSSEVELAWDDAFRAETLRSLWMFGSIISWLAVASAGVGIVQGYDSIAGTFWSTGIGPQLFNWGFIVIIISFSVVGAQNYFRFRLWPALSFEGTEPIDHATASAEKTATP